MTHLFEGQFSGEFLGHEDHSGDPEEDDIVAGLEEGAREEHVQVVALVRPPEDGKREQAGRKPLRRNLKKNVVIMEVNGTGLPAISSQESSKF